MAVLLLAMVAPIPADPPIGGAFWTLVVPTLLFVIAFGATWMLYRRFTRD